MTASAREMGVLVTKVEMFEKKIDEVVQTQKDHQLQNIENHKEIISMFEKLDIRFASKNSVDRLWIIVWSIV